MEPPVARLPCCHYFCRCVRLKYLNYLIILNPTTSIMIKQTRASYRRECVMESVRHKAACPVCKAKVSRRDVAQDDTMDRITRAFKALHDRSCELKAAVLGGTEAIPWLHGVEDEMFHSPSKSLSGTAIEKLRKPVQHTPHSPATVQKSDWSQPSDQLGNQNCQPAVVDASIQPQSEEWLDASCERRQPTDPSGKDTGKEIDKIIAGLEEDSALFQSPNGEEQEQCNPNPVSKTKNKSNKKRTSRKSKPSLAVPFDDRQVEQKELEAMTQEGRRIPRRLLPWNCGVCTFLNKGSDTKCAMCETLRCASSNTNNLQANASGMLEKPIESGKNQIKTQRQRRLTGGKRKSLPEDSNTVKTSNTASWTGGKQTWVLLASGLDAQGKEKLSNLASVAGGTLATEFSPRVTHVVCGTSDHEEHGSVKRTFKVLMGLIHGCAIVKEPWVNACLKAGEPCKEERFLVRSFAEKSDCSNDHKCTQRTKRPAELMKGIEVQLKGDFVDKKQIGTLLKAAGASLTKTMPASGLTLNDSKSNQLKPGGVILVDCRDKTPKSVVEQTWYARAMGAGVPVLSHSWAMDSIAEIELRPLAQYYL